MDKAIVRGCCLCGGVIFDVVGEPETCFQCFCQHCQKSAGAPSQLSAKFNKNQVHVKLGRELLKTYILKDTLSGQDKHKVFCSDCGCTLWTIPMRHGGDSFIVRTSLMENGLQKYVPNVVLFDRYVQRLSVGQVNPKSFATMPGF
ncbi:hypothetical protein OIDMADRAFT_48851 [Oidiodendron maius Zn]|uniref:CENP-V/GFA domain-containing protein n=1 Tax=Oidiodendron maius (strain Zn) TaxID=913774 RepID=A0A0C3I1S4_OIDMZ|nr:hypothetical protein OIDMADRAFT_48851 [Oidiodendron maius Zn]